MPRAAAPSSDIDPFAEDFLADPYAAHAALRAAGPVVWLRHYGIWAAARYDQVRDVLSDWRHFCSAAGVGLSDFRRETPWRPPSLVLETDPPDHGRARAVLARVLSPRRLSQLRATLEDAAEQLAASLARAKKCDGIADIATAFPLRVFPDAMGLDPAGRENLLVYGDMAFNAFGPPNRLRQEALGRAEPIGAWIAARCEPAALAPGGIGRQIHQAAETGEITPQEASLLVRSLLTAGVDTTVNAIGNALLCFAQNPDQWSGLRANPARVREAFEEALRFEAPVQTFFRTTTGPIDLAGVPLEPNSKILLFLGAANRCERHWTDPDRFDISRPPAAQLGFGTGIHGCVGQMLARLEGEILFTALLRHIAGFRLTATPVRRLNNTLRGLASLPLDLVPA